MSYFAYVRVSTNKQDISRQTKAIREWASIHNIKQFEMDTYIDYISGKNFSRVNYQKMKNTIKKGDYIIVKEVDRLGRDWDGIKREWQELKDMGANIIIIDMPILSDPLPHEMAAIEGLDMRLIKEQILSLMCYSAQKEREKISQRTKEALAFKKMYGTKTGRPTGRPCNKETTNKHFIDVLRDIVYLGMTTRSACEKYNYPRASFMLKLRKLRTKYETSDYETMLKKYMEEGDL
jgi:DNA invertase Pin-like site-specific DNA recombinase